MKKIFNKKIFILTSTILVFGLFIPFIARAELGDMDVVFSHQPLFYEMNILPGDTASETITITNNTEEIKTIGLEFIGTSTNELDDQILFEILNDGDVIFGGLSNPQTLAYLLSVGEITIDKIRPSETKTLTINADFPTSVGNPYQLKSSIFDIKVGYIYFKNSIFSIPDQSDEINEIPKILGEDTEKNLDINKPPLKILGVELPITGGQMLIIVIIMIIILSFYIFILRRRQGEKLSE